MVEARADFSRLPFFDGARDYNADIANLSESIVSTPFQNENLVLKTGLHLHWRMPQPLTKSLGTNFPAVPNRWLVSRSRLAGAQQRLVEKQWIIESDYLYPDGKGEEAGSVCVPYVSDHKNGKPRPFRYLGRKLPLATWRALTPESNAAAEYFSPLTAIGYGDPTFAAFYPNCHSVFGFHDGDYRTAPPSDLQYDVLGWYAEPQQDFLKIFLAHFEAEFLRANANRAANDADRIAALQNNLQWQLTLAAGQEFPRQMVCCARLYFNPQADYLNNPAKLAAHLTVTVGNTGTEALSAYLAAQIDSARKDVLEDQLEALHLAARLESRQLDTGAKFQEARHEKSFTPVPSGSLWTIRAENESAQPADAMAAHQHAQLELPTACAQLLHELNHWQRQYDRNRHEITTQRKQLFSDWYKYMLCVYPPEDTRDDYPDIDEVKFFITEKCLEPLRMFMAMTGEAQFTRDANGRITGAAATKAAQNAVAYKLVAALNALLSAIKTFNDNDGQSGCGFVLRQISGPRYWQPNEPVVLLARANSPTPSSALTQSQTLTTGIALDNLAPLDLVQPANARVLDRVSVAAQPWLRQPWQPFLLEWEVEVFNVKHHSNAHTTTRSYTPEFITSNYELPQNAPELALKPNAFALSKAANVYSGTSLLTPHAPLRLREQILAFIAKQRFDDKKLLLEAYAATRQLNPPTHEQLENFLLDEANNLTAWYVAQKLSAATDEQKARDATFTALRAYQKLFDLEALSQALSGFNEALLMHKQTMQLPIDDPLGFDDYKNFSNSVKFVVDKQTKSAPQPLNDFNPIRSGAMKILRLRLVDTFGQTLELNLQNLATTDTLRLPQRSDMIALPPRVVQPARLHFRWLAAQAQAQEANAHPHTSPICGWVLPNNLDNSLMIYDRAGKALGALTMNPEAPWQAAPGAATATPLTSLEPHLQRMVQYLLTRQQASIVQRRTQTFLQNFISTVDAALENIAPETFAQHQALALLLGRPLALVRASLGVELLGTPAVDQSWEKFRQDLLRNERETDNFTAVQFPIRLGEYQQLNDGVVGYWKENASGYEGDTFYAPQSDLALNDNFIVAHSAAPHNLVQALAAPPQVVSMLIDPTAKVHATCGVLPAKALDIPSEQYAAALQAIEVTFLAAPLLTDQTQIKRDLPSAPGYVWSWLEKSNGVWLEVQAAARITKAVLLTQLAQAVWDYLRDRSVAWLTPVAEDTTTAKVVLAAQRKAQTFGADFAGLENQIAALLEENKTSAQTITQNVFQEKFSAQIGAEVWSQLLASNVAWLKAGTANTAEAEVISKDRRGAQQLPGAYASLTRTLDRLIDVYQTGLLPTSTKATFAAPQTIREGWLKLKQSEA